MFFSSPVSFATRASSIAAFTAYDNMPMLFGGMIVLVIISTIAMALLIGTGDIEAGLAIGAIVGFGIAAARVLPQYMFAQEPNRLALMQAINLGIGITLTGAIIGAFNA